MYKGVKPKYDYGMYIAAHLAQFTSCFGPVHVTAVKHLIRYLKGTSSCGLTYRQLSDGFGEIGYSDADWGSNLLNYNLATLTLSVESQFHGQSKHIDIRHHFMRDIIQKELVTTLYVPSKENLADAFTKALASPQFSYLIEMIMGKVVLKVIDGDN
ncbi:Retrovirus-related Pol polyprotein from transposon TNT 1-94 [Ceratobasidium sp. AG-Ba]|nr:Retrovirus-related Pol polyprotein from transposon TNT 1-94 [Ceratobasidium sp. AG-Ba]